MIVTDFATLVSGGTAKPAPIPLLLLFGVLHQPWGIALGAAGAAAGGLEVVAVPITLWPPRDCPRVTPAFHKAGLGLGLEPSRRFSR